MREKLEAYWATLSTREKRLFSFLLVMTSAFVLFLPMQLLQRNIDALKRENQELESLIAEFERRAPELAARKALERSVESRYEIQAPPLSSFLEAKSREFGLSISAVTNQPEVQEGPFRRRHVRATFPGSSLKAAIKLMNALEASPYPIAIERIHIDHFSPGEDRFNIEIGIITYDRQGSSPSSAPPPSSPSSSPPRAGPPSP
ncbi:MAG: type II secretion system protein M [Sandaracinaceae bacterium]|nr:type II secretion system protein M [Sandaracinaceae bacterium]MDW8245404.1 type II secretion system protein GspM [Sandaracinaceae bacterium]